MRYDFWGTNGDNRREGRVSLAFVGARVYLRQSIKHDKGRDQLVKRGRSAKGEYSDDVGAHTLTASLEATSSNIGGRCCTCGTFVETTYTFTYTPYGYRLSETHYLILPDSTLLSIRLPRSKKSLVVIRI